MQRQTSPESQGLLVNSVHCGHLRLCPHVMTEAEVGVMSRKSRNTWGHQEVEGAKDEFSPSGFGALSCDTLTSDL